MSEWSEKPLSQLADIRVSNVDKKSSSDEKPVFLCNYMDAYANDYIRSDISFMAATATAIEIAKFKVDRGDVLITKDSETPDDIGIPAVVMEQIEELVCGYHLALLKPKQDVVDPVFLCKQLATERSVRYFGQRAAGSTRYGLSIGALANIPILLPSLAKQRAISRVLVSIDAAIEKTEALIDKYQQIKAGLMHDLFTHGVLPNGQLRPSREQAPELYQETAIGWIPKEWHFSNLSCIANLFVGFAFKSDWFEQDGIALLRGDNVGYGSPDWKDRQCLPSNFAKSFADYLLEAGDVVIGMDRTFTKSGVKITTLTESDCPALLVQRVGKFLAVHCDFAYLRWLVVSPDYLRRLINQQKGMDIPHLSKSEILEPLVPVPPRDEQRLIANRIQEAAKRIEVYRLECEKLRQQKLGLMQDLLTGKVPVKVDAPEAADA